MAEPLDFKIGELLKDVQLDYSPTLTKLVDDTIFGIRDAIENIPDDLKVTAKKARGFVRDVRADKAEFTFKKPTSIKIGGSYSIRCVAKPDVSVDLLLRLPKECFHEKDYLNHRYHAKRFLYLCIIKKYLVSSLPLLKVEWSTLQNEVRKPILVVNAASTRADAHQFSVRIIPTATSVFDLSKLNMTRNNVRACVRDGEPQPTPIYNSSILEDMLMEDILEQINETFLGWKELGEALVLLKVWARQRSAIYTHDCLCGHLIAVILYYLARKSSDHVLTKSMNAMQIFRITLNFIASSKFWAKGLSLQNNREGVIPTEVKERKKILRSFPVVICDPLGYFNLAYRMKRSSFLELQNEAALTLSSIEKTSDGGFLEIFLTKIDFPVRFDYCIRLNFQGNDAVHASGYCSDDECWRLYEEKVHSVLSQGLRDRAKFIRVIWRNYHSASLLEDGFRLLDKEPLLVGITLDSLDKALRVVDVGPHAENKEEALMFRRFWGEKSELRRFKDGNIAESTVWECKQWERYLVIKRIVEFVLQRHLSISKEKINVIADQLDFCLSTGKEDPISFSSYLLEAYEILSKRLRLLDDIPLKVSSVQPLDAAFRFTSVLPPEPHPLAKEKGGSLRSVKLATTCIQPLEIMIQLEGSGNWPINEVATEKTKSAFLLKIGESLENRWNMTCVATEDTIDVLWSGYAFRLKILHERGLSLLKNPGNQVKQVASADKVLLFRSQHASMINGLQGRFPIYGPVVRLAKRWATSHLFSSCLVGEAIELLVAHLFLKPWPFSSPSSRIMGFLRFLRLIAEYDWNLFPLIIDINGDFTSRDEEEINDNFRKSREEFPHNVKSAMYLATSYDKSSEAWSVSSPTTIELRRFVAYARSSANLLTKLILEQGDDCHGWERLFKTPLNNYDAVVLLHRDRLAYPQHLLFPSDVNTGRCIARGAPSKDFSPFLVLNNTKGNFLELKSKLMVDFDPLKCYLADLEREFGDEFKLWYDSLGGDAVGVTWDKSASKKQSRGEDEQEGEEMTNVLRAVGEAGKGLVKSIHLLKSPRVA
ncbi:hypothetical protein V2J09_003850 [Rumex salicifolius]